MAPEVLKIAKVQRWAPEELLRTFVEAEIAARDASNEAARRKAAGFPVTRRLEDFDPRRVLGAPGHLRPSREPRLDRRRRERRARGPRGHRQEPHPAGHRGGRGGARAEGPLPAGGRRSWRRSTADSPTTRWVGSSSACCATTSSSSTTSASRPWTIPAATCSSASWPPPTSTAAWAWPVPLALRVLGPLPARAHHRGGDARPAPAPRHHRRHQW